MGKRLDAQVDELRGQVDRLAREIKRLTARDANPKAILRGWWLGKLTGSLSQGGSSEVAIWWFSNGKFRDSQFRVTAHDWFLNKDESIEADTKVRIDWYHVVWAVTNAYCAPDDTDDALPAIQGDSQAAIAAGPPPDTDQMQFLTLLQQGAL